ncbi:MAG: putative phage-related endonuclease, partial [Pseudohongiellaceae bacterium]
FKTRLEIDESKAHPALDYKDIVEQIKAKHYAVHGAKMSINLTVAD